MNSTRKRDLSDAPLYIMLSGDMYADKSKVMVGTVIGDGRLTALEAFLDSLSSTQEFSQANGDCSMSDALRQMVEKCHPKILANSDVVMEVTSKLDLDRKEMTHTFRIRAEPRK